MQMVMDCCDAQLWARLGCGVKSVQGKKGKSGKLPAAGQKAEKEINQGGLDCLSLDFLGGRGRSREGFGVELLAHGLNKFAEHVMGPCEFAAGLFVGGAA